MGHFFLDIQYKLQDLFSQFIQFHCKIFGDRVLFRDLQTHKVVFITVQLALYFFEGIPYIECFAVVHIIMITVFCA